MSFKNLLLMNACDSNFRDITKLNRYLYRVPIMQKHLKVKE